MNNYERMQDDGQKDGVGSLEFSFQSDRIKGLYSDGIIAINSNIETDVE